MLMCFIFRDAQILKKYTGLGRCLADKCTQFDTGTTNQSLTSPSCIGVAKLVSGDEELVVTH